MKDYIIYIYVTKKQNNINTTQLILNVTKYYKLKTKNQPAVSSPTEGLTSILNQLIIKTHKNKPIQCESLLIFYVV